MALWTPRGDGVFTLPALAAQEDALKRGGELRFHPTERWSEFVPWADGSLDRFRLRLLLPEGVSANTPTDTLNGWRTALSNGWVLHHESLQETKLADYLGDFLPHGIREVVWRPVSAIVDNGSGEWVADVFQIEGAGEFDVYEQPDYSLVSVEPPLEPPIQPVWARRSLAIYGSAKRHNRTGTNKQYMSGKVAHWPAPNALFWNGVTYRGRVKGRLVWDAANRRVEKHFPMAEMQALIAVSTRVSTDATAGYTTAGASISTNLTAEIEGWTIGTLPATGTVDSVHWYYQGTTIASTNWFAGLYDEYDAGDAFLPYNLIANSTTAATAYVGGANWKTASYSGTKPSLTASTQYWLSVAAYNDGAATIRINYDATGGGISTRLIYYYDGGTYTSMPNPSLSGLTDNTVGLCVPSAYVTYTAPSTGSPWYYYAQQ